MNDYDFEFDFAWSLSSCYANVSIRIINIESDKPSHNLSLTPCEISNFYDVF